MTDDQPSWVEYRNRITKLEAELAEARADLAATRHNLSVANEAMFEMRGEREENARLRDLIKTVGEAARLALNAKFDGCNSMRRTTLSVIADDCAEALEGTDGD